MHRVRLIREIHALSGKGPGNGQWALQRALRRRIAGGLDWLSIGGMPSRAELPWFWCWEDRTMAVRWAIRGRPFVQGPNTLFLRSSRPRIDRLERMLLDSPHCPLVFTESEWYRDLILRHRGPKSRAEIVLWPYPIDPRPPGPAHPAEHDLLLYVKNGEFADLPDQLLARYPKSRVVHYGHYVREDLWEIARHARCCCYLADDDRGPLALAEILLCGCPTIGLPTGAPFVRDGQTGFLLADRTPAHWLEAVDRCFTLDRRDVAARADAQFDTHRIVDTVLGALDAARRVTAAG